MKKLLVALLLVACAPKRVEPAPEEKPLPANTQSGLLAEAARTGGSMDMAAMMAQVAQMQAAVNNARSACEALQNKEVSPKEERALGNLRALDFISQHGALIGDAKPEVTKELARIGLSVARASARPSLPWTFGVIENAEALSFAGGGGYVLISTGLVKKCANEAQLAGVLAREVARVVQQTDVKNYRTGLHMNCLMSSATGATAPNSYSDLSNPETAEATWQLVKNTKVTMTSSAVDAEADAFAVSMLRTAGYDAAEYERLRAALGQPVKQDSATASSGEKPPLPSALRF
ncbi:MAG: M48 family metalloprotease [Archangium sp.]